MPRDRGILFYPLIMAALPPVYLYAGNTDAHITFAEFLAPFGSVMVLTVLALLLLRIVVRDNVKVGIIVFLFLLVFFSYGAIFGLVSQTSFPIVGVLFTGHRYLIPVLGLISAVGVIVTLRYSGSLATLLRGATLGALILVVFNVSRIVTGTIGSDASAAQIPGNGNFPTALSSNLPASIEELPDIYYLIFDGYSNASVLDVVHDFDNGDFIEYLESKGFFVPPRARSNYNYTTQSLTSSLNMRYLSPGSIGSFDEVTGNAVMGYVQHLGYQYVHLGTVMGFTRRNPHADIELLSDDGLPVLFSNYTQSLLNSTPLRPIALRLGINLRKPFIIPGRRIFNENMRYLSQIPHMPGPTFTFSHNYPPHPPYIFDRLGNLPENPPDGWLATEYTEQILYVNTRIEELVDNILDQSVKEPIIVIQGDHGSRSLRNAYFFHKENAESRSRFEFESTGILNAYYLPEYCRSALYPTITPVNSFRLIFDSCLGSNFGLLEERSYLLGELDPIIWPESGR